VRLGENALVEMIRKRMPVTEGFRRSPDGRMMLGWRAIHRADVALAVKRAERAGFKVVRLTDGGADGHPDSYTDWCRNNCHGTVVQLCDINSFAYIFVFEEDRDAALFRIFMD
jgi:hypothetical protein